MSDLRDFTGKNRKFTGTGGERISTGSTGERVNTTGTLRFNSTTSLMEYYSGSDWKPIDSPPTITNFEIDGGSTVTSATIDNEASGDFTLTVNGSLFDTTAATVQLLGQSETLSSVSLNRNSANLLTATFTRSSIDNSNSPYTIKVTNGSGLAATLAECISNDTGAPSWYQSADTTVTLSDLNRAAGIAANALCGASNGTSGTFSVSSGSLPGGLSISATDGAITGTATAVGSNTTSTFTVQATGDESVGTRQFKITINAPVVTTYNSTSGFTFSVPSGVTSVGALVVAGGGGGGSVIGGGGGAGGMVETTSYPVSPGGNVSGNVGGGGAGQPGTRTSNGQAGSNSVFGNITATGGGGGNSWSTPNNNNMDGGSGGGGTHGRPTGGTGNQGSFSPVGATGYGNPGYQGQGPTWGGGGGGAGEGGPATSHRRIGANGRASTMSGSSTTYAGGGGGAGHGQSTPSSGGNGGGGNANTGSGQAGSSNRGGGGGGGYHPPDVPGGSGGSGVVIVKY